VGVDRGIISDIHVHRRNVLFGWIVGYAREGEINASVQNFILMIAVSATLSCGVYQFIQATLLRGAVKFRL
jgi:hypothetical protein